MTYREQIQRLIQVLDLAYDLAGGIRDTAKGKEKDAFNMTRKITAEIMRELKRLEYDLDDERAEIELGDRVNEFIKKRLDL